MWAIWLSAVPYGLWSERIRQPSMEEHVQWVDRLEVALGGALDQFELETRGGSVRDLAEAFASLIEGVWLNQCLSDRHPSDPSEPISTLMRRAGRLLWLGRHERRELTPVCQVRACSQECEAVRPMTHAILSERGHMCPPSPEGRDAARPRGASAEGRS